MFFKKRYGEAELLALHLTQLALNAFVSEFFENLPVRLLALESREGTNSIGETCLILSGLFGFGSRVLNYSSEATLGWLTDRKHMANPNTSGEQVSFFLTLRKTGSRHSADRALICARRDDVEKEWELQVLYNWEGFAQMIRHHSS
ncbi:MAG: hypothetical protein JWL82_252 [Parcubacteria group bacterium]|nr:hypothetical protein [Parcubacteria group bacterium]